MKTLANPTRYIFVSATCWLLWIIGIPLLNALGIHYALATVVAFAAIAVIGFALHCYVTFGIVQNWRAFFRYNTAMVLNLPITIVFIGIGHDWLGLSVTVATAITSAMMFVLNYFGIGWAMTGAAKEQ